MLDIKYYVLFGKSNMYEMKLWIQGEWGGIYMWNFIINKYFDNFKLLVKLVLGSYLMLLGVMDVGLFFKLVQMLLIGKLIKNLEVVVKLINFLLNSKEGVEMLGLECGVLLSKVVVQYLIEVGIIKENDLLVVGLCLVQLLFVKFSVLFYFDDLQIVVQFGILLQYIDYGQKLVEEIVVDFQCQVECILKWVMC